MPWIKIIPEARPRANSKRSIEKSASSARVKRSIATATQDLEASL